MTSIWANNSFLLSLNDELNDFLFSTGGKTDHLAFDSSYEFISAPIHCHHSVVDDHHHHHASASLYSSPSSQAEYSSPEQDNFGYSSSSPVSSPYAWQPRTADSMSQIFPSDLGFTFDSDGNRYSISRPETVADVTTKKRRHEDSESDNLRSTRAIRPKVVEGKGVQCIGLNRKKNTQCRNAALMEYIGPRPQYCAEHIEMDPESLYEKCKSDYQKEPGDNRGCKEVVLREFGICYKHFHDLTAEMVAGGEVEKCRTVHDRIQVLTVQLEAEAAAAKRTDADLYQRKNKLLPKFHRMRRMAEKTLETLLSTNQSTPRSEAFRLQA